MSVDFLPLPGRTDISDGAPFYYTALDSAKQNEVLSTHQGAFDAWGVGVIPRPLNALEVTSGGGLTFNLSAGVAFVHHSVYGPFFLRQDALVSEGPLEANRGTGNEIYLFLAAQRESFHDSAFDGIGQIIAHDSDSYDGGVLLATVKTSGGAITSVVPNRNRFIRNPLDIHGLDAKTSVSGGDEMVIWDSQSTELRKLALATLLAGTGGGSTAVTQLSQLIYNLAHPVQADTYISEKLDEIWAEIIEMQGGPKKFPDELSLLADLTSALAVGLFEVNPPAMLRTQMSALGRGFGKGQNSTPDVSPNTGKPNEAPYHAASGLITP